MSTQFPIQVCYPERDYPQQRRSIPWDLIAPHEKQAQDNHGAQTLKRLAERHGLSAHEAVAAIEDMPYCKRWPTTDGSREARHAQDLEAINRLEQLCREHEDAYREEFHGQNFP